MGLAPTDQSDSLLVAPTTSRDASPNGIDIEIDPNKTATDELAKENAETDELAEEIAEAVRQVEAAESLDVEKKAEALEYLRKAAQWLQNAKECRVDTAVYRAETDEVPQKLEAVKQALAEDWPEAIPAFSPDATLVQLEQLSNEAEREWKTAQEELVGAKENADSNLRTKRKTEIVEQQAACKQKIEETEAELKATPAEEDGLPAPVRQLELQARQRELESQTQLLEAEQARMDASVELFPLQRDLAQRRATWHEKMSEAWRATVTDYRKAESERQAAEARRIASEAHPALRELAERNAELAESRTKVAECNDKTFGDLESTQDSLKNISEDYESDRNKVEIAGMTPTVGLLLRDRREHLPDAQEHKSRVKFAATEMQRVQIAQLELDAERSKLGDLDETIESAIVELGRVGNQFEPGYLENMVRGLMQDRREYLDGLLGDYKSYHENLSELSLETGKLLVQVDAYRRFIDEHVLWIRSTRPLAVADVQKSWQAFWSFVDVQRWSAVLSSMGVNARQHPLASAMLLVACIGLLVFRQRIAARLENLGIQVAEQHEPRLILTLRALLLTGLLAGIWPLTFWGVGWWIGLNHNAPDLALGVARGLQAVAAVLFIAELFRQVCRKNGLAENHFAWQISWVHTLNRSVNWLVALGLPVVFLVTLIKAHDGGAWQDSLGRIALILGFGVLAVFMHNLLHPWKGELQVTLARMASPWPSRLRYLWYTLGVGFPVGLAALVGTGYVYSADQLIARLQLMICLILGLALAQAVLLRALKVTWQRVSTFRASVEARRRVLLAGPSEANHDSEREAGRDDSAQATEIPNVDLQLGQLVRGLTVLTFFVAAWFIWADMFPAFGVLDGELWSTTRMVSQESIKDGETKVVQVPERVPITYANVMFAVIALIATLVMTRTVPGLLEISILGRLPIDNGARHAIVIVSRYSVMLVGVVVACRMLGMTWGSVQWLAAAMTVGLGFGLQEIFANLVSGLIILFERPIRIGDMVTVDGVTGKITRMQIRATTITDLDRRELVVPNKRFITDNVVNWSLSDPISRFIINIGISYDSDPEEAHQLLLKVAKGHPLILDEPKPAAIFTGFGDSTLDLELRVFIASRDHYATALHEVNLAVERVFRAAGIEIAFPQQDLHIRGVEELTEIFSRDRDRDRDQNHKTTLPKKAA